MTDTLKIKTLINDKGYKYKFVAKVLGITYNSFYRKVNNKQYFTANEIQMICDLLHIDNLEEKENIFFNQECDKKYNVI